jgi:hypothetical protein
MLFIIYVNLAIFTHDNSIGNYMLKTNTIWSEGRRSVLERPTQRAGKAYAACCIDRCSTLCFEVRFAGLGITVL